ncbi:MAG: hypothetical protein AABY32_00965 [Nanoarchaeota archaeon]
MYKSDSPYYKVLELAGATIKRFGEFGSYQGEWWAEVIYKDKRGWVNGFYGSCTGCDALLAEFGRADHNCNGEEYYDPIYKMNFRENCKTCQNIKKRLIELGEKYLENIMSKADAITLARKNSDWDVEADKMVDFIKNKQKGIKK